VTTRAEPLLASLDIAPRRPNWAAFLPYVLALPIVVYEALFILYPIFLGLRSSLFQQPLGGAERWIGFENYGRMLGDAAFWAVMRTTLVYMLSVVVVAVGFGLFAALVLNRQFRGRTLARG
jgi:ABC-type sugar transport system permease subunit